MQTSDLICHGENHEDLQSDYFFKPALLPITHSALRRTSAV